MLSRACSTSMPTEATPITAPSSAAVALAWSSGISSVPIRLQTTASINSVQRKWKAQRAVSSPWARR